MRPNSICVAYQRSAGWNSAGRLARHVARRAERPAVVVGVVWFPCVYVCMCVWVGVYGHVWRVSCGGVHDEEGSLFEAKTFIHITRGKIGTLKIIWRR